MSLTSCDSDNSDSNDDFENLTITASLIRTVCKDSPTDIERDIEELSNSLLTPELKCKLKKPSTMFVLTLSQCIYQNNLPVSKHVIALPWMYMCLNQ